MDLFTAIHTRRSAATYTAEVPPREAIEAILEAGCQAPNHHLTQPWRFFVLAGKALEELGELMAAELARTLPETHSEQAKARLERERCKPLRPPVLIAVGCLGSSDTVKHTEDMAACAAAIQNMLLAAHGLGLAAAWKTGAPVYNPAIVAHFGLDSSRDKLLGFIYLGTSELAPPLRPRRPAAELTQWWGF